MQPEFSLLPLNNPTICACPQPYQSSPRTPLSPPRNLLKNYFHIILPRKPRSLKWPLSLRLPQNSVCISPLPHMCYMPCPFQYDYNEQYLVRSTDHAAPHYSTFSIPLLPHPSHPKYPPQHPNLKTHSTHARCSPVNVTDQVRHSFICKGRLTYLI